MAVSRDAAFDDEPGDASRGALLLGLRDRLAPEELLVELAGPGETGLDGVRRLVDLVPVQRETRLEPERVAGPQADRLQALGLAGLEQRVPHARRVGARDEDLEAVLAGIPGARDRRHRAGHLRRGHTEGDDVVDVHRGDAAQDLRRARTLRRDERGLHREAVGCDAVDDDVVDDRPALVRQQTVASVTDLETRDVARDQAVEGGEGARALEEELAHMREIEEPRRAADRAMLRDDTGVLDGHLPSRERDHLRAERAVPFVQWRVPQAHVDAHAASRAAAIARSSMSR